MTFKWMILGNFLSGVITTTAPYWHRYNSIASPIVLTTTTAIALFFFVSELGRDSGIHLNYIGADAEARSERLLNNVLPSKIADQLIEYPNDPIADRFDEATVLFADIVGFTSMSERLEAEKIVSILKNILMNSIIQF